MTSLFRAIKKREGQVKFLLVYSLFSKVINVLLIHDFSTGSRSHSRESTGELKQDKEVALIVIKKSDGLLLLSPELFIINVHCFPFDRSNK